ncbi:TetR/AcrR family transcriptional regulator [Micromonospora sp. DR5-3]|uniref:TetR/AcrR family transcriptional regulator n=1 Tax=unclassified Micromonospora TaxID=2617518 RepID=UPI0011D96501|nr:MULTISPECIES: TetR/AcrR family transcriptional regulator [unclassified Micromonospora]MCW3816696.1 TetR/AcrR family transcriptional regulator [Micromonospora sp. DR5-3]TYC22560.1 TetR/AcrR family transcriptional regulator [Micromonospora sp. MP36]
MAGDAREALLDRCVSFLKEGGFSQLSLREIASGTGTSHRMLIYHFGSREGLLTEVVGRVEAEQRAALAALATETDDPVEVSRRFWRRLADPALAPAERLFFEIYAHALFDRSWTGAFRASVVAAWAGPVEELFVQLGHDRAEAHRRARLSLAATRGLLLDLLITGDRAVLDAAADLFAQLIAAPPPSAA